MIGGKKRSTNFRKRSQESRAFWLRSLGQSPEPVVVLQPGAMALAEVAEAARDTRSDGEEAAASMVSQSCYRECKVTQAW